MTMTTAQRLSLAAAALAATLLAAPAAEAQPPGPGSVQLHLDVGVLDLQVFPDVFNQVSLGVGGLNLGPGIGYQVADGIAIGARTAFGFTLIDPTLPGDTVSGQLALLPYLELFFGPGNIVPFVAFQVGFVASFPDGRDAFASAIAGVRGGIHAFLTQTFSISPWGALNFLYNGGIERAGFELALGFSLVGWIGGAGAPAPQEDFGSQVEPQPANDAPPPPPAEPTNPEQGLGY